MADAFCKFLQRILSVAGTRTGSLQAQKRKPGGEICENSAAKRLRSEVPCFMEFGVVQALLQKQLLSGNDLAILSCVSKAFHSACDTEDNWQRICTLQSPALQSPSAQKFIQSNGGYKRFFCMQKTFGGTMQQYVESNKIVSFMERMFFLLDIKFKKKPFYSCQVDMIDLPFVRTTDGVCFRMQDITLNLLLDRCHGSTRQALGSASASLSANCMALRRKESSAALLITDDVESNLMGVGRLLCVTIVRAFRFPGMFRSTKFFVELTMTLSSSRPLSRDEDVVEADFEVLLDSFGFEVRIVDESNFHRVDGTSSYLFWKSLDQSC